MEYINISKKKLSSSKAVFGESVFLNIQNCQETVKRRLYITGFSY